MMSDGIFLNVPEVIRTYNVTRSITAPTISILTQTAIPLNKNPDISPAECIGFALLILTTIIGNTLVLSALFLDKRLHSPSFFLIANMAIADLLLGIAVLPFSSVLELLSDRWIFGQSFCSAWLALDVLCCTASIIALMAVSIDRYIGVTRPLNYGSIMTIRRTIFLILIVWAVSILTSVVPLFGLTDRGQKSNDSESPYKPSETCKVNQNTFYTIFSSMISFYIPVIILLILYSRVYQEAKKQGEKLENDKRRLYELEYQRATEQARQQEIHRNQSSASIKNLVNHSNDHHHHHHHKNEVSTTLLNHKNIPEEEEEEDIPGHILTATDGVKLKNTYSNLKHTPNDEISRSGSLVDPKEKKHKSFSLRKRLFSKIKRNSLLSLSQIPHYNKHTSTTDELLIIKRKLHNLKREKKAFRTVGLILGALLICWLPFFVTLPVMSILQHQGDVKVRNSENTWFKIAFWLGYCNSALNPFVYAFSNRAIRRAFRQVIFRRCCCCFCPKIANECDRQYSGRRQRAQSGSLTTNISLTASKGPRMSSVEPVETLPKIDNDLNASSNSLFKASTTGGPAISFADFLAEQDDDDISSHDDNQAFLLAPIKEQPSSTSNS